MKLVEFFIKQTKLLNLIVALVIGFGVYLYFNGQKEAFPQFTSNQIFITTVYPGASAKTVENLITYPIEKKIKDISGVDKVTSTSRENVSSVVVTVSADYENRIRDVKRYKK